jgi:L-histidine N-alpha-methyltransferase
MEAQPIRINEYLEESGALPTLADDVREGLTAPQKSLPPKYFYDELGSRLFERICETPEYYPTRTEMALLRSAADEIIARVQPEDLVELGPGSDEKARILLDAMERRGPVGRYVPVDVSPEIVERSARSLTEAYPGLTVHAVIGDFLEHLDKVPGGKRQLVVFLGSTIGNLEHDEAVAFLRNVAENLDPGDAFLLGTDLIKDPLVLEAAYNDAQGLTEKFNRNILEVINRHLNADFCLENFEHIAFFNHEKNRIEIYLESKVEQTVGIDGLRMKVAFEAGERIHTEYSQKFTRESVQSMLEEAGMTPEAWLTDEKQWFGLALARRA